MLAHIAASAIQRELHKHLVAGVSRRRAAVDAAVAAQTLEGARHLAPLALSEAADEAEVARQASTGQGEACSAFNGP